MKIIKFFLDKGMLVNLLTIGLIIIGVVKMMKMNKEAFPSINFDIVSIVTHYPGASPIEVENYVTSILEDELKSVSGIDKVQSTSIEGMSTILVYLDPDLNETDKNKSTNDIQRAIERTQGLPTDLPKQPIVKSIDSGDMPVIEVSISGDLSQRELYDYSEKLKDKLEVLDDVRNLISREDLKQEYWVEADSKKLKKYNIGLPQILRALKQRNINLPGGKLTTANGEYLVRTIGELKTTKEIENIILRSNGAGRQVFLKDVASVKRTFEDNKYIFRTNKAKSINFLVTKKSSGDIINLVDEVKLKIKEFELKQNNKNLKISLVNDLSEYVSNRLSVLLNNGYIGLLLVLVVLLLFLSKGIALVTALGMPVTIMGSMLFMFYFGSTINLISMFALVIVLGIIVDDAIIVGENIWQHFEMGKSPYKATVDGVSEVFWPVTATVLTTIAAFSPLMMVSGIFGKFIQIMPQVIVVTLSISLLEAMFILPVHAYDWLNFASKKAAKKDKIKVSIMEPILKYFIKLYMKTLNFALNKRYLTLLTIVGLFLGSLYYAKHNMQLILFPSEGVKSFFIRAELSNDSSLEQTSLAFVELEKTVLQHSNGEIKDIISHIGIQKVDNVDPFAKYASNVAQIQVFLKSEKERKHSANEIIERLKPILLEATRKNNLINLNFKPLRMGPPVGRPVAIKVQSENLDNLKKLAIEIEAKLKGVTGIKEVYNNFPDGKKELKIVIDNKKASRSLLSVQDIALHINGVLKGQIATSIRENNKKVSIRVRYDKKTVLNISSIKNTKLLNKAGLLIPLKKVANFTKTRGVLRIKHNDYKRTVTIAAQIDEQQTSSTKVNNLIAPFVKKLEQKYPDTEFNLGGEYEETQESLASLLESFIIAIGLIFLILATQFKSLTQPFVVMSAIPFGAIGVIIAFALHGLPLSFLGFIGFIGLSGVVVNDSIVLVDFINKARNKGMEVKEAILYSGERRVRAVWLTTITTVFGLLPLVYGIGGEDKFLMPAAAALGYGLIFGTVLILILTPTLYYIRIDIGNVLKSLFGKIFARSNN